MSRKRSPYREMSDRHQQEVNAFPIMYAFNNKQFENGMVTLGLQPSDTDKVVSIGYSGFIRKTDAKSFGDMMKRHRHERKEAMETDDEFLYDAIYCELVDHEYGYTGDDEDALEALGITYEMLASDQRLFDTVHRVENDIMLEEI